MRLFGLGKAKGEPTADPSAAMRKCGNCSRWLGRYGVRLDSRGDSVGNCGKIPHHTSYPEYWEKSLDGAYTHGDAGWGRLATTEDFYCNRWEPAE